MNTHLSKMLYFILFFVLFCSSSTLLFYAHKNVLASIDGFFLLDFEDIRDACSSSSFRELINVR